MSETALQVQVRVFVAIELPQTVIDALGAVQGQLQATGLPLRYAGAAGLHLTLAFIGEIPAPQVETLTSAVQRGSAGVAAFNILAEGMGMFPNARAPRVVWAGVEGAPAAMAALTQLQQGIVRELVAAHFPVDRRFDPHLTLARTRDRVSPRSAARSAPLRRRCRLYPPCPSCQRRDRDAQPDAVRWLGLHAPCPYYAW